MQLGRALLDYQHSLIEGTQLGRQIGNRFQSLPSRICDLIIVACLHCEEDGVLLRSQGYARAARPVAMRCSAMAIQSTPIRRHFCSSSPSSASSTIAGEANSASMRVDLRAFKTLPRGPRVNIEMRARSPAIRFREISASYRISRTTRGMTSSRSERVGHNEVPDPLEFWPVTNRSLDPHIRVAAPSRGYIAGEAPKRMRRAGGSARVQDVLRGARLEAPAG